MKIFISADIEGVTGIAAWEETSKTSKENIYFREQMTKEVVAACEGANLAGATEILIKDAHSSGRNIDPSKLPENARIIRGWSGHPYKMVDGLDSSFHGVAFVGYHSDGSSNGNPLAHTMSSSLIDYIKLNGEYCSEFLLHAYVAAYLEVPIVLVSGDLALCKEVNKLNENIITIPVNKGKGNASISINPEKSLKLIKEGMDKGLRSDLTKNKIDLPEKFTLEIRYNFHGDAYKRSFYPGVLQINPKTIRFEARDYFEIMRATSFLL